MTHLNHKIDKSDWTRHFWPWQAGHDIVYLQSCAWVDLMKLKIVTIISSRKYQGILEAVMESVCLIGLHLMIVTLHEGEPKIKEFQREYLKICMNIWSREDKVVTDQGLYKHACVQFCHFLLRFKVCLSFLHWRGWRGQAMLQIQPRYQTRSASYISWDTSMHLKFSIHQGDLHQTLKIWALKAQLAESSYWTNKQTLN